LLDDIKKLAHLAVQSTTIEMAPRPRTGQPHHTCAVHKNQDQLRAREDDARLRGCTRDWKGAAAKLAQCPKHSLLAEKEIQSSMMGESENVDIILIKL